MPFGRHAARASASALYTACSASATISSSPAAARAFSSSAAAFTAIHLQQRLR